MRSVVFLVAVANCSALSEVPAPHRDVATQVDDRLACGGCHEAIAAQWAASAHRSSWSDPVFTSGYAIDPEPECRACHAPLASEGVDPAPDSVAAQTGIACRSCHVVAEARVELVSCGGCHEFDFPPGVFHAGEPMQRTVAEWRASGASQSCEDCHMPWRVDAQGRRYRDHRVLGIDDVEFMASAVRVEATAAVDGHDTLVRLAVHADATAHAFPTGDMFRAAELRIWPTGDPAALRVVPMRRDFGPAWRADEDGRLRVRFAEVRDTRPAPGQPRTATLRFAGEHAELRWTLVHLRMPQDRARRQGLLAVNERLVQQGHVDVH